MKHLAILAVALALGACGDSTPPAQTQPQTIPAPAPQVAPAAPVIVNNVPAPAHGGGGELTSLAAGAALGMAMSGGRSAPAAAAPQTTVIKKTVIVNNNRPSRPAPSRPSFSSRRR